MHWIAMGALLSLINTTVELVQSDTGIFRHPGTSDKNLWSQNISVNYNKTGGVFRNTVQSDTYPWCVGLDRFHYIEIKCMSRKKHQFQAKWFDDFRSLNINNYKMYCKLCVKYVNLSGGLSCSFVSGSASFHISTLNSHYIRQRLGTPVNKTDRHDRTEILFRVALSTITPYN